MRQNPAVLTRWRISTLHFNTAAKEEVGCQQKLHFLSEMNDAMAHVIITVGQDGGRISATEP